MAKMTTPPAAVADILRGLLSGSAKVAATTGGYSRKATLFCEKVHRELVVEHVVEPKMHDTAQPEFDFGHQVTGGALSSSYSHSTSSSSSSGGGPIDLAPSKVSGTRIQTGSDFGVMARNTGIIVDKTLICKAFLKPGRAPVCVCLPRRFGKTFDLSTIEEFLNVVNSSDAHPMDGHIDEQA
ncbi:hypothetical protein GQ54DRAFT_336526, partial [Martensiomyces pterosporus]